MTLTRFEQTVSDGEGFFQQVDMARKVIRSYLVPAKKMQDATPLRVFLEHVIPGYFSKRMLAVAFVREGYDIVSEDQVYFSVNARVRTAMNAMSRVLGWDKYPYSGCGPLDDRRLVKLGVVS